MKNGPTLDLFTMIILKRRFEAIITEMVNALFRSGRSGVLNTAMDFSCSITDNKFQSISVELGLPVHVASIHLIPQVVVDKFGETIRPGDCFANNSGYLGNTHCADFTLCAPVFYKDEIVFFTIGRAHVADMGFPAPTTYSPKAKDVYEEGLLLPCVRIQQNNEDVMEVIDICKANIRSPEQFYGDYLGILAAVRTGERRICELCDEHGVDVIKTFLDDYQDYAERMAIEAIRKLPGGSVEKEIRYDSELASFPDGIPIRAKLTVDPDDAYILLDLTDNVDNLPLGINMTEATVLASCTTGVFNVLGPDIPRCGGAFRRLKVKMREGCLIGKPKFPAATSSATTNLAHALTAHVQSMFAKLGEGIGIAYGGIGLPASCSVVSGKDFRRNDKPFVNQMILGHFGGPAVCGHDGWLTFGSGSSQGALWQSSVEIVELQHPILVEKLAIAIDSSGAGEWDGGPGCYSVFSARKDPVRFTANAAAHDFPPGGIHGGMSGAPTQIWKVDAHGNQIELPISLDTTLLPGEKLVSQGCGGGGYGDPLDRDPELVRRKVREGWISRERANRVYGVVLATDTEEFAVDWDRTEKCREALKEMRGVS